MALVIADRVLETCSAPGTGTVSLSGATAGYQSFAAAIGNANTCYYTISDQSGSGWEVGIGTVSTGSPNTLSRDTVLASSNAGSKVNFSTGTQNVFVTYPAEKAVYLNASGNITPSSLGPATFSSITDSGNLTFTGTGNRITGDFTNATVANRVAFQTSTTNGSTSVYVLPNGTGTTAGYVLSNNSDPTNAGLTQLLALSTESSLRAAVSGTGTYLPMTFFTSSSERMRIDTSGNLGIGTGSPSYKLDVSGSGSQAIRAITTDTSGTNIARLIVQYTGGGGGAASAVDLRAGDGYTYLTSTTSTPVLFGTNTTERMRIDSSGNVGIGTSSPASSAILDAQSTTKGVRMPNMTTTQKNAISSPVAGLMVFDTTLAKLCVYSGSAWQTITSI